MIRVVPPCRMGKSVLAQAARVIEGACCLVCLMPIGHDDASVQHVLSCQHGRAMHQACLQRWFTVNQSCPMCKAPEMHSGDNSKLPIVID